MGSNIDSGRFGASPRSFGAHYILSFQTGRLKQLFDQFPGVLDSAATKWRWHVHIQQGLHRTSMGCFTKGSMIENMTSFISYIRCILYTLKYRRIYTYTCFGCQRQWSIRASGVTTLVKKCEGSGKNSKKRPNSIQQLLLVKHLHHRSVVHTLICGFQSVM